MEVTGNLIEMAVEDHFDVIIHGCNCFCAMGNGIALDIKTYFPDNYALDCMTAKGDVSKLGTFNYLTYDTFEGRKLSVVNAYTQFKYWSESGDKTPLVNYQALSKVLREIADAFPTDTRFGLPMIGAGLARGDWNIISEIIKDAFCGKNFTVVRYDGSKPVPIIFRTHIL